MRVEDALWVYKTICIQKLKEEKFSKKNNHENIKEYTWKCHIEFTKNDLDDDFSKNQRNGTYKSIIVNLEPSITDRSV